MPLCTHDMEVNVTWEVLWLPERGLRIGIDEVEPTGQTLLVDCYCQHCFVGTQLHPLTDVFLSLLSHFDGTDEELQWRPDGHRAWNMHSLGLFRRSVPTPIDEPWPEKSVAFSELSWGLDLGLSDSETHGTMSFRSPLCHFALYGTSSYGAGNQRKFSH